MRASVMGSAITHLVGLILLFAVKTSAPLIIPGPDIVQVALVQQPMTVTRPAPPPAPKPKPKEREAPKIKPVEDTGVKLTPPERKPKEEPEPEKTEPELPPASSVPLARVGSAGLSGSVSVDAVDFEFTYYLLLVRNRIAQNWTPPSGLVTGGEPVRAVVYFKVARNGTISAVTLEESSSRQFFDRSTLRAVLVSDPLPPLPVGFSGSDLGVHFGFEYATP